jgi:cytochrome c oxidase assembly protein subunit 15
LLGGLRVVLYKDQIGIFHAALAQIFFVLTCVIAVMTGKWWNQMLAAQKATPSAEPPLLSSVFSLRKTAIATTALILFQLILGATMRHQHAGLAVHDFPLAYGKLWPATDATSVQQYNAQRVEITNFNPITAFQIQLHMAHRVTALLIFCAVAFCAWRALRKFFGPIVKLSIFWFALIFVQASLGAATVLTDKAADVATAHVLVGALSLATGAMFSIILARFPRCAVGVSPAEAFSKWQSTVDLNGVTDIGSTGKMPAAR